MSAPGIWDTSELGSNTQPSLKNRPMLVIASVCSVAFPFSCAAVGLLLTLKGTRCAVDAREAVDVHLLKAQVKQKRNSFRKL